MYNAFKADAVSMPYEIINAESIENSRVSKRYMDSMIFYSIYRRKAKVDEATLKYAFLGMTKGNRDYRPENGLMGNSFKISKTSSSDIVWCTIFYDISLWSIGGAGCSGYVYKEDIENSLNDFYGHDYYGEINQYIETVESSIYLQGDNVINIPLRCGDMDRDNVDETYWEHYFMLDFMEVFEAALVNLTIGSCLIPEAMNEGFGVDGYFYFNGDCGIIDGNYTNDPNYVPTGTGSTGGGGSGNTGNTGGGSNNTNNNYTASEDEKIRAFDLEGNAKCAFELLVETNGYLFQETIASFGVEGSPYDLEFIHGSCGSNGGEACTDPSYLDSHNTLVIKIDDNTLSVLEMAANLLHEGIHAEIFRYVHENGGVVDPNDRINLYNHYRDLMVEAGVYDANMAQAQHQHMADMYIYPIANAIKELDGHRFPVEKYLPFAWSGLEPYGWDGYYNENLEFVVFNDDNIETKIDEIVESSNVGNDCN